MNLISKLLILKTDEPVIIEDALDEQALIEVKEYTKENLHLYRIGQVYSKLDGSVINPGFKSNHTFKVEKNDFRANQIFRSSLLKYLCDSQSSNLERVKKELEHYHLNHLQFSYYQEGKYEFHRDISETGVTILFLYKREEKNIVGGDFLYKLGDKVTRIPFKDNQLIIFKSSLLHKVDDVSDKGAKRYSLQIWPQLISNETAEKTLENQPEIKPEIKAEEKEFDLSLKQELKRHILNRYESEESFRSFQSYFSKNIYYVFNYLSRELFGKLQEVESQYFEGHECEAKISKESFFEMNKRDKLSLRIKAKTLALVYQFDIAEIIIKIKINGREVLVPFESDTKEMMRRIVDEN